MPVNVHQSLPIISMNRLLHKNHRNPAVMHRIKEFDGLIGSKPLVGIYHKGDGGMLPIHRLNPLNIFLDHPTDFHFEHSKAPAKPSIGGFHDLLEDLDLDVLMIDTHPGLNEETLLSIAISDALAIILRPDQQDYQGTSVTVEVARKLSVPNMYLVVNKLPAVFDPETVRKQVEATYHCPVAAVLPHSDEMMALMSAGIFVLHYPDHPIAHSLSRVAVLLLSDQE